MAIELNERVHSGLKTVARWLRKAVIANTDQRREILLRRVLLRSEWLRTYLIRRQAARLPRLDHLARSFDAHRLATALAELTETGCHIFPEPIGPPTIARLRTHLDGLPCCDLYRAPEVCFRLEDAPADAQVAYYRTEDLVRIREVLDIANEPAVLALAQAYFGCAPTISTIKVWWSFPGGIPLNPQRFHRDLDDLKFLKLFVYLTDVDPNSGPHTYVFGSQHSRRYRSGARASDAEVQLQFGATRCHEITGPRGTRILEDTFGLHKGQPPRTNPRLVLQIEYVMSPMNLDGYQPPSVSFDGFDSYINRMIIQ